MTMTRALSSVLILVFVLFAAMFAITKYSDAQEVTSCPAGTVLSADGTICLSDAVNDNVVTTASCIQGVLSDDGKFCIVPRTDTNPVPAPAPAGDPAGGPTGDVVAPIPTFTG